MFKYYPNALPKNLKNSTLIYLKNKIPWKRIKYYSLKRKGFVDNPRATWVCGFHEPYLYNIDGINPHPFPKELHPLIKWIQEFTKSKYNFMLFSKYETGQDSITWHSDDEKFITKNTPITSLTLLEDNAEPRRFYLKHSKTKERYSWELENGDIFKMDYECQKHYQHAILKQPETEGIRYSITFRHAANEFGTKNYYTYN
jgi:alkylated DNA repair dioxygenase AlkB